MYVLKNGMSFHISQNECTLKHKLFGIKAESIKTSIELYDFVVV